MDEKLNYEVLTEISTNKIIEGYKKLFRIDVTDSFSNIPKIKLCRNIMTGHCFFIPENAAGKSEFYEKLQNFSWYYQKSKWEFEVAKKYISSGNLLEVGCGRGFFIESLLNNEKLKIIGSEYNEDAILVCKEKGLNVEKYSFHEFKESYFDYIVSFQVLEHLSDYEEFFKESFRALKPGGKLIIGVPNTNSFVFYPFSDYYFNHVSLLLNLPPHHMSWWNRKTIKKAGEYFGFKMINIEFESMPIYRYNLVSTNLALCLKAKFLKSILKGLLSPVYKYFFKGDTILIVFEK